MKKTSRRTFGKQLTGALATLPILAAGIDMQGRVRTNRKNEAQRKKTEHNTPPPAFFMPGSLIFESFTTKTDWDSDGMTPVNNRRKWSVKPKPYGNGMTPTNIFIAHLKLVDGAGEMLFHFDNDATEDHQTPIRITATLQKNGVDFGDCRLTTAGDHFELEVPENKRIKKKANDSPTHPDRQRVRYMHESGGNPDQCDWVALRIDKGSVNLYNNSYLNELPGFNEMKMMVWWENM